MPKFVIERNFPGAGKASPQDLQAIAEKSCGVLKGLGPQIQWVAACSGPPPTRSRPAARCC